MTLDQAVAALEAEFGQQVTEIAVAPALKSSVPSEAVVVKARPMLTVIVASGGEQEKASDPAPAFYVSAALAVKAWRETAAALLRDRKPTAWALTDGPHLDKWFMTAMDGRRTHRTAEDRFSVTATIGFVTAA